MAVRVWSSVAAPAWDIVSDNCVESENGWPSCGSLAFIRLDILRSVLIVDTRQKHGKDGAAQIVLTSVGDAYDAAVAFCDLFTDPQSQPGPDVSLSGKKRFKDLLAIFLYYTRTIIRHLDFHPFALRIDLAQIFQALPIDFKRGASQDEKFLGLIPAGD
jgi:hypothetical protein